MNRKEVLEYFKTISEIRLKNFNRTLQYCDANENYIQDFKEKTDMYDMITEALEKQTPKKPIYTNEGSVTRCPNCEAIHFKVLPSLEFDYCARCGQAIDWSEE